MTEPSPTQQCSRCGADLPAEHGGPLCPACLLQPPPDHRAQAAWTVGPARNFEPPAPADLAEFFPQLDIEELLGRGGMGAVYRARQKSLDRPVALKILPPEVAERPGFSERFTREAQALARLSHPHIVTVFDFGQAGPYAYLLMEHIDGVNLRQVLSDGRLAPDEALGIVPQLCDALQFAHAHGVVHRDIKPENILLDTQGHVKIADFGLAKLAGDGETDSDSTRTGQVVGTMYYMAPEQIEHPERVDHRADIYSMGVVIYEMLTGELPLGRFQPPSECVRIDVRLDEVVLRTLEKQPERRYSSAAEVKTDVHRIETEPPESPDRTTSQPTGPEAWPDRLERYAQVAGRRISSGASSVRDAAARAWTSAESGRGLFPGGLAEYLAVGAILVQLIAVVAIANTRRDEEALLMLIVGAITSLVLARLALRAAGPPPLTPARSWLIGVPLAVIYLPVVLVVAFWPVVFGFILAESFYFRPSRLSAYSAAELRSFLLLILSATAVALTAWWMLLSVFIWQLPGVVRLLLRPFADGLHGGRAKWFALLFLVLATLAVIGLLNVIDRSPAVSLGHAVLFHLVV
jgi:hypothetical protein